MKNILIIVVFIAYTILMGNATRKRINEGYIEPIIGAIIGLIAGIVIFIAILKKYN